MLNSGSIIGNRYEIISEIGRGGMAKVYKAKDIRLDRNVAIKILNQEYASDKKFVRKFIEEARAAAGISHQNIVNVFDVGEEDDLHYIVMELVEGITLKKYIENVGAISSEDTCRIAIQIAYGIEAAHNNNIIHRDIKPQNIVISDDGYAKVADFGIAKATNGNTINNAVAGSVHYMAPEQARSGFSDEKSDIYSLGITMYEMVTGRLPFDTGNNVSIVWSHLNTPIVPPSEYVDNISYGLEQIILKATNKRANERYSSITDMLRDLKFVFKHPNDPLPYNDFDPYGDTVFMDSNFVDEYDSKFNDYNDYNDYDNYDNEYDDYYYDDNYNESEGEVVNPNIKKIMNVLTIVGGTIVTLLLIFLVFKFGFSTKSTSADKVPNIIDMTLKEARKVAETNKIKIEIKEFDKTAPEDKKDLILSQEPKSGDNWPDKNDKIIYVVIAGTDEIRLSDLTGRPKDQAIQELEDLGLSVNIEEAHDDQKEEGIVIKSNPLPGSSVNKNEKITLVISKGAETITIPSISGLSKEDAERRLKQAGLNYSFEEEFGDKDRVTRTNPEAGSKIKKSDPIVVFIGNGKEGVEIPDLTGKSLAEASMILNRLDIGIDAYPEESDTVSSGDIIRTEPSAGTKVEVGTKIKVYVSSKSKLVPNVLGMKKDKAVEVLHDAGLKVYSTTTSLTTAESGTVVKQSIDAGKSVDEGESIIITVAE